MTTENHTGGTTEDGGYEDARPEEEKKRAADLDRLHLLISRLRVLTADFVEMGDYRVSTLALVAREAGDEADALLSALRAQH